MPGDDPDSPIDAASWLTRVAARAVRPAAEYADLVRQPLFWGHGVPPGDGHFVLVLPGLGSGDWYLSTLRAWIRRVGYRTVRSGLDANPGWSIELVQRLSRRLIAVYEEGGEPVTIVGHSVGGVIARSMAVGHPEAVRQLIVLGAPLRPGRRALSPSVPITAIRSPDDLIIDYESARCRDPHGTTLDVRGSHTGLVWNAEVYRLLGNLLPQGRRM